MFVGVIVGGLECGGKCGVQPVGGVLHADSSLAYYPGNFCAGVPFLVGGFGVLMDGVQQLYELFFTPGDGFGDVVFEVCVPAVFVYGALGDVVLRCCFTVFCFGGECGEEFASGVCCFSGCFLCGGLCAQIRVWVAVHSSTLPDASSSRLGGWRRGDV